MIVHLVRRYPIWAFLVWFYSVGWAIAFIPYLAKRAYGMDLPMEWFIVASTLLGLFLPVIVVTRIVDGPEGLVTLQQRITRVAVNAGWYAIGVVLLPAVSIAVAVGTFGLPSVPLAAWLNAIVAGFFVATLVGCASTNLWEEAAWMGFVQARLQARYPVLVAAVITGFLFMLQHVPLMVMQNTGVLVPIVFFVVAVPFRALMAWLYNRTGSLLVVGLVHAAGDAIAGGTLAGIGLLPRLYPDYDIGLFGIIANVILGLIVIAATRGRLGYSTRASTPPISAPALRRAAA